MDALTEKGCPICLLLERGSRQYLNSLFYEFVNDTAVRKRLQRSGGFCSWHAWLATEISGTNTGIAIIYRDLLEGESAILRSLHRILSKGDPRRARGWLPRSKRSRICRMLALWERRPPCPVCESNARAELSYLKELAEHFHEEDFRQRFRASQGLCLPHLRRLAEGFFDHPNFPTILEEHLRKYERLVWDLEEFWRKFDYRFQDEPYGSEADSWLRVIGTFVGKREVLASSSLGLRAGHPGGPTNQRPGNRLKEGAQRLLRWMWGILPFLGPNPARRRLSGEWSAGVSLPLRDAGEGLQTQVRPSSYRDGRP